MDRGGGSGSGRMRVRVRVRAGREDWYSRSWVDEWRKYPHNMPQSISVCHVAAPHSYIIWEGLNRKTDVAKVMTFSSSWKCIPIYNVPQNKSSALSRHKAALLMHHCEKCVFVVVLLLSGVIYSRRVTRCTKTGPGTSSQWMSDGSDLQGWAAVNTHTLFKFVSTDSLR